MALGKNRSFEFSSLEELKNDYKTLLSLAETLTTEIKSELPKVSSLYSSTPSDIRVASLANMPTIAVPTYDDTYQKLSKLIDKLNNEIPRYDTTAADNLKQIKTSTAMLADLANAYNGLIRSGLPEGSAQDFFKELDDIAAQYKDALKTLSEAVELTLAISKGLVVSSTMYSADPVNLSTGNFCYEKHDLQIGGSYPIQFTRTYNAIDDYKGVLGRNWIHNFEMAVKPQEEDGSLRVTLEDGRDCYFHEGAQSEQQYFCEKLPGSRLVKTDSEYRLFSADHTYSFESDGRLYQIKDENDGLYTLEYNKTRKLIKISSPSGAVHLKYNKSGLLAAIEDGNGRLVAYEYQEECLTKVLTDSEIDTIYQYDPAGGRISSITNAVNNIIVKNIYDDRFRITQQVFPDGSMMKYEYADREQQIHLTERNGSKTTYEHDEEFRITRVIHADGIESYTYDQSNNRTSYTDKKGNRTRYEYDENGNQTRVIDALNHVTEIKYHDGLASTIIWPNGASFQLDYDGMKNLTSIQNPLKNEYKLTYDNRRRVTELTLPDGGKILLDYDKKSNIKTVTMPDGGVTSYRYDDNNRVSWLRDAKGSISQFTYTSDGNISQIKNPQGHTRQYFYTKNNLVSKIIDYDGSVQKFEYNKLGKRSRITHEDETQTIFEYDQMWNVSQVTRANGAQTSFVYNALNQLSLVRNANGFETKFKYDKNGNLSEQITPNGNKTSYEYDPLNRTKKIVRPDGGEFSFVFNELGKITGRIDPLGQTTQYEYNLMGQLTQVTDPLGHTTSYTYTALGDVETITDATGGTTRYEYFPGGQLKQITLPEGETTEYKYDLNGNVIEKNVGGISKTQYFYDETDQIVKIINPLGHAEEFKYDALGRLITAIDHDGQETSYTYSPRGDMTGVVDVLGNKTEYTYDTVGNLTKVELFEGQPAEYKEAAKLNRMSNAFTRVRYEHDLLGNTTRSLSADGSEIRFVYDGENRIIEKIDEEGFSTKLDYTPLGNIAGIHYADGRTVEMQYNGLQKLVQMKDWLGTLQVSVNENGYPEEIVTPDGEKVSYVWDAMNRKQKIVQPGDLSTEYRYDLSGKLTSVLTNGTETKLSYDPLGRLSEKVMAGSVKCAYAYDEAGQLSSFVCQNADEILEQFSYQYDKRGNPVQIQKERKDVAEDTGKFQFSYDALSRLTGVSLNRIPLRSYEYDAFGNRTKQRIGKNTVSYQYNSLQQLVRQDTVEGTLEYNYDKRGNVIQEILGGVLNKEFTFDAANQLSSVTRADNVRTDYQYNGTMQRVGYETQYGGQPQDKVQYILDFTELVDNVLYRGVNGTVESYARADNIFSINGNAHYITDPLGTPLRVVDNAGNTLDTMVYTEFGAPIRPAQNRQYNAFGFTGYENDFGSGLYYAKARYYNSFDGRFVSKDPLIGTPLAPLSFNGYPYARNMPQKYTDRTGLFLHIFIGAAVGAVVGAVSQAIVDVVTTGSLSSWETYVGAAVGGAITGGIVAAAGPALATPAGSGLLQAVNSSVSTFTTQALEKATGREDRSWGEIGLNTVVSAAVGFGTGFVCGAVGDKLQGWAGKQVGIQGINAGRNSWGAVFKSGLTKIINGNASRMSAKVMAKGFGYMLVDGFIEDLLKSVANNKADEAVDWLIEMLNSGDDPHELYEAMFGEQVNVEYLCIV